jgi:hypothetical protein
MTTGSQLPDRLERLGHSLREAAAADLGRSAQAARRTRTRTRRRGAGLLAAAVVAVPGVALAANALISTDQVARSIPNGTLSLLDTHPRCTVVRENVEFDCVLDVAPSGEIGAGRWQGTVEPTVDDTKHTNGGCRSLNAAGTHWRCYVGQEAVRRQIIGPALLGVPSSGPGVG